MQFCVQSPLAPSSGQKQKSGKKGEKIKILFAIKLWGGVEVNLGLGDWIPNRSSDLFTRPEGLGCIFNENLSS
jgi:hypothetical protein